MENGGFRKKRIYFSQVSNAALHDVKLSLKAKGLYALIQSYLTIEGFTLYKNMLNKQCTDKETSFNSAWNELKESGYLKQYKLRDSLSGKWIYQYELLDISKENPQVENPQVENPQVENPHGGESTGGKQGVYNNTNLNNTNNIYTHIFEFWNSKKIIIHKELKEDIKKSIEKCLKEYSEKEIIQAIERYSEILRSQFYFNYKWSLKDFLNRKNGISTFMEDGSIKVNYEEFLSKQNNENNKKLRGWG